MRALAAREPCFSDGSAPTLLKLGKIYDKRFNIGLTEEEMHDLVNFMKAL
jgi:hypothetical protein